MKRRERGRDIPLGRDGMVDSCGSEGGGGVSYVCNISSSRQLYGTGSAQSHFPTRCTTPLIEGADKMVAMYFLHAHQSLRV